MAGKSRTRPYNSQNAGALSLAEAQLDFATADERVLIASLPAGAVILDAWFEIVTPSDGTSDEGNIGYGVVGAVTSDDILDAVDLKGSAGVYPATRAPQATRLAAAQDIYAYNVTTGTPTAGEHRAFIVYARTADNAVG